MTSPWSKDGRQQRYAAEFVLPAGLTEAWQQRHPEAEDLRPARQALRQWLRIHTVAPDDVTNPSTAVDELWERLIRMGDVWGEFVKHGYDRSVRRHQDDPQAMRRDAGRRGDEGLALAYALTCVDEGLDHIGGKVTTLFGADRALALRGGTGWVAFCGHDPCRPGAGNRCISHDLLPLVPEDLPDQIPYHHHRELPPAFEFQGNRDYGSRNMTGWGA